LLLFLSPQPRQANAISGVIAVLTIAILSGFSGIYFEKVLFDAVSRFALSMLSFLTFLKLRFYETSRKAARCGKAISSFLFTGTLVCSRFHLCSQFFPNLFPFCAECCLVPLVYFISIMRPLLHAGKISVLVLCSLLQFTFSFLVFGTDFFKGFL
jgi:hypothetical protein